MKQRARFEMAAAQTMVALLAFAAAGAQAQQTSPQTTLTGGVTYSDPSSQSCEEQNAGNPYAGTNPLVCHGTSAPQASNGQCNLTGMTVLKHVGETCYYCSPIDPPIRGIIVPMDQVGYAEKQNWDCGLDSADVCMAVCQDGTTFVMQTATQQNQGQPQTGGVQGGPTMGGGYPIDTSTSSENQPCQPPPADEPPAAPYYRYQAGFQAGFNDCKVTPTIVGDVAAAAFGSVFSVIPSTLEISASPQTLQSAIHPAGTPTNANPYLEGEADGGRLCAWLLKNEAGWVTECPGKAPPVQTQTQTQQLPLTANATVECAPLSKVGYIFCSGGSGTQSATCDCNDQITIPLATVDRTGKAGKPGKWCAALLAQAQTLPKLQPTQIKTLELDVANAKTMLTRAKQHLANGLDVFTNYTMWIYFNSTSADVKAQLNTTIDKELTLLGNLGMVEQHIYPDLYAGQKNSPIPTWAAAYVEPITDGDYPLLFIRDSYWTGSSDYRADTVVHELSHLSYAGGKVDLTYDVANCWTLAHYSGPIPNVSGASQGLQGTNFGTGPGQLPSAYMQAVNTKTPEQWKLVKISTPTGAALVNADSFALFVQQLASYPLGTDIIPPTPK